MAMPHAHVKLHRSAEQVLPDGQDPPTSFSQVFRLQDMPDKGRKRQRALLTQLLGWNHGLGLRLATACGVASASGTHSC
eukprot:271715-Amphidinium_carterae.1